MEQDKFDDIAKAMAGGADRRSVLKRIAGGVLGGLFAVGAGQAEAAKKQCGKDGAKCHGTGHCCKGYYCYKKNGGPYGKCTKKAPTSPPPPPACKKDYEKCSSGGECCSKYCDTAKGYGKCKPKPVSPPPPPCTPKTCDYYKGKCGTFDDKCGGTVYCGCPKGYDCDKGYCKEQKPAPVCGNWCSPYDKVDSCPTGCYCKKVGDKSYVCAPGDYDDK